MPRPSKKAAEDKNKGPAAVAAAPVPQPPMMPTAMPPQGIPMQPHHQYQPQHQHFQQVQMPPQHQQPPPPQPTGVPPQQQQGTRVIDNDSFLRVRDSVSLPRLSVNLYSRFLVTNLSFCLQVSICLINRSLSGLALRALPEW